MLCDQQPIWNNWLNNRGCWRTQDEKSIAVSKKIVVQLLALERMNQMRLKVVTPINSVQKFWSPLTENLRARERKLKDICENFFQYNHTVTGSNYTSNWSPVHIFVTIQPATKICDTPKAQHVINLWERHKKRRTKKMKRSAKANEK